MKIFKLKFPIILVIAGGYGCFSKEAYFHKRAFSLAAKYQSNLTYNPKSGEPNALKALTWKEIRASIREFERAIALMPDSIAFAVDGQIQSGISPTGTNKVWVGQQLAIKVADSFYLNKNKQKYIRQKGLVTPHAILLVNKKSR